MTAKPAVLFIALVLAASNTLAEPSITFNSDFYTVRGTNVAEIYQDLQRHGPRGKNGDHYHAHTQWDIQWSFRWIESASRCRLNRVTVNIGIDMLLPRLHSLESLSPSVQQSWNRYYRALTAHEEHHKAFGIKAAQELEQVLLATPALDCALLEAETNRRAREIIDKYDALEKAYDRDTNQ